MSTGTSVTISVTIMDRARLGTPPGRFLDPVEAPVAVG